MEFEKSKQNRIADPNKRSQTLNERIDRHEQKLKAQMDKALARTPEERAQARTQDQTREDKTKDMNLRRQAMVNFTMQPPPKREKPRQQEQQKKPGGSDLGMLLDAMSPLPDLEKSKEAKKKRDQVFETREPEDRNNQWTNKTHWWDQKR